MRELSPGLELGARFVLVRRVGRGGSAEVWLADDRERGERVALKVLHEEFAADGPRMARLAEEVARAQALPADVAVCVHGLHRADGLAFVAMEYAEGGDLGQLRGRPFEAWSRAAIDVAAALEALHGQGLVHRDLKCANVLLDEEGRARLADFGLTAAAGATVDGGSPYNASPQQLRGEPAAPADDLYAFGALLYELIAGHPPFYPEITRDRVLHEPVPPLVPRGEVPIAVRELALELLAKSPDARPRDAGEARTRLAAAAAGEVEAVAPIVHALPGAARVRRRGWLPVALVGAVVVAVAALLWLQPRILGGDPAIRQEAEQQARARSEQLRTQAERAEAQAQAKDAAEAARTKFGELFAALDARAAARWATAPFAQARDAGARAAQRFDVGDYVAAQKGWEDAVARLAEIEKQAGEAVAAAVKRGHAELAAARTGAAREAFRLALAIDPKHAPASAGLARADRVDQALAVVDAALAAERGGRIAAAEEGFRKALSIDAEAPGAREGLARIAALRARETFAAAMSRGLAEQAAGRVEAAREAFRQALAIRPGAREAEDALAALEQRERAGTLRELEARARAAEAEERWDDALAAWREAAKAEPSLASAREGIARATPRAELQARIDALNQQPERLWDPEGRAEARKLLGQAALAPNPRERLAAAAAKLGQLAAAAESPVRLRVESDGLTNVSIYRVGQYGTFSTREIELLPGRYTIVGTRNGYRDVRREVVIPPGTPGASVVVRCEEPI